MNEFHMRTIEREKAPHQQDAEICFAFVRDLSPNIKHIVNKQRILLVHQFSSTIINKLINNFKLLIDYKAGLKYNPPKCQKKYSKIVISIA